MCVVQDGTGLHQFHSGQTAELSDAHRADWQHSLIFLKEFQEACQLSRCVGSGHDLENVCAQFFRALDPVVQSLGGSRLPEIVHGNNTFYILLPGRLQDGAKLRGRTKFNVNEVGPWQKTAE